MDSASAFKVVCDHCDAKLASVFCHSDGAFLCPQCDAQVHSVNKLAQRHMRVPCQSCPVWAYREAKSRGRLLDMPLAACLTRNMQMDIFDGTSPCWPSTNPSSAALVGTPQSDASSPQPAAALARPANGSPISPAPGVHPASNSWPQNGALASYSQPQPVPQPSVGDRPLSPYGDADAKSGRLAVSPVSASSDLQAAASAAQPAAQQLMPERWSVADGQSAMMPAPAPQQAAHSQQPLQRSASQELMDAVESMDVAMLLDTFCAPLDQLQEQRKASAAQAAAVQEPQPQALAPPQYAQEQQLSPFPVPLQPTQLACADWQQSQMQQQLQAQMMQNQLQQGQSPNVAWRGMSMPASEPMAVPSHRQQPAMRTLSGMSCSGLGSRGATALEKTACDEQELPFTDTRSSSAALYPTLDQVASASSTAPSALAMAASAAGSMAGAGWPDMQATAAAQRQLQQLQLQQLQLQQQAAAIAMQQQQSQQQIALAAAAQHQAQMQQAVQLSVEELPRTSPINIGSGPTSNALAAAAARRDASLRAGLGMGLGLSDPGFGRGLSLAASLPAATGSASCLPDGFPGLAMGGAVCAMAPPGMVLAGAAPPGLATSAGGLPGAGRSLDAASSLNALPFPVGGSGSASVSPFNCNSTSVHTLAGASSERQVGPFAAAAQQYVLPGSAPSMLGLGATGPACASGDGSCELSEVQLVRLGSDGCDPLAPGFSCSSLGGGNALALSCADAEAMAAMMTNMDSSDSLKDLDPERLAQLSRYRHKRVARMRPLADVGGNKLRSDCRKQVADARPRVKARFAKAHSMDALPDGQPASPSVALASSLSGGLSGSAVVTLPATASLGRHGMHMQRIDEEADGVPSGQMAPPGEQQQPFGAHMQHLRRAQSSSVLEGATRSCAPMLSVPAPEAVAAMPTAQDCVITDGDLAALGFDELPAFSGGHAPPNEDMDESADSMNDGHRAGRLVRVHQRQQQPAPQMMQVQGATQQSPQLAQARPAAPPAAPPATQAPSAAGQRLSVLDRAIMYGTDRSQFSAAQLSLLDSILADQYKPSGAVTGR